MKVIVYVEGKSDKLSMEVLLERLIEEKRGEGIFIDFYETAAGDRKKTLLTKIPIKAANIIVNDPDASVVVMPDLYPPNKGFRHKSFEELKAGVLRTFNEALESKGIADERLCNRLKVFCFKHDLEALILASPESLKRHLGISDMGISWKVPVEDQNQNCPPKQIVERIFARHYKIYHEVVDAPMILRGGNYQNIAERCLECFDPFVQYLSALKVNA